MKVVYADRARRDIEEIYDPIALHNRDAAQRVEDLIRSTCEGLADFPYASLATDEPNVRRLPIVRYPYTVYYRVNADRRVVEIARVVHGARIRDLGRIPSRETGSARAGSAGPPSLSARDPKLPSSMCTGAMQHLPRGACGGR